MGQCTSPRYPKMEEGRVERSHSHRAWLTVICGQLVTKCLGSFAFQCLQYLSIETQLWRVVDAGFSRKKERLYFCWVGVAWRVHGNGYSLCEVERSYTWLQSAVTPWVSVEQPEISKHILFTIFELPLLDVYELPMLNVIIYGYSSFKWIESRSFKLLVLNQKGRNEGLAMFNVRWK